MSHDNMELQRFMSENGSVDVSMSESFVAHPAHQHTDADTTQNPMYLSIPDATSLHQKFIDTQNKQHSPSPVPMTTDSNGTVPSDSNQYDIIPDKSHRKGDHPGGVVTMHADNILYTDTEEAKEMHLRHKTLTMDKASAYHHYRGSVSPEVHEGVAIEGSSCMRRGCCWCWGSMTSLLLVIALAAGAFSLVVLFTGIFDVCNCKSDIQALESRILMLETRPGIGSSPPTTDTPISTQSDSTDTTPPTTPPPLSYPLGGVANLTDVNLFRNCTTRILDECTITTGILRCQTEFITIEDIEDTILSISCVRSMESNDSNPFIATLGVYGGDIVCLCYLIDEGRPRIDVKCGLQLITCPTTANYIIPDFTLN